MPERDEAYGRSRSLDVRVCARAASPCAPARRSPSTRPARGTAAPKLSLSDLLLSRDSYTDLRLRVGGFTVRQADERLRLGIVVETDDPGASLTSVGAVLVEGDGRVVARWFAADVVRAAAAGRDGGAARILPAAGGGDRRRGPVRRGRGSGAGWPHAGRPALARLAGAGALARRRRGAAAPVRRGTDRHRVVRHLRRRGRHEAVGGARSWPAPQTAPPSPRCRSR